MKNTSQKGKWGHVGAPPKKLKAYPRTRFTIAQIVARNENVCELTIRKRIKADVKAGTLVTLPVIKQPKKAVGRPKFCFQLKTLVATPTKVTKTPRVTKPKTATVVTVSTNVPTAPTPAPVTNTTTPVVTAPEVPATVVTPAPLP